MLNERRLFTNGISPSCMSYSYPDQQVGTEARRACIGLFPAADED